MAREKKVAKPPKSELFVGSSAEAVPLSNCVVEIMQHQFRVTPWTAGVFEPSSNTLQDLLRQAGKTAYSVFVFAKDDKTVSRYKQYESTRDNVIFELGLFMGKLGPENCFILVPKDRKKLKIPSDLEGFGLVQYEDDRLEDNPKAAFAAACASIISAITRRSKEAAPPPVSVTAPETALALKPPTATPRAPDAGVVGHVQDLLGMIHQGAAGLEVKQSDDAKFTLWARNALHMALTALRAVTPNLPAGAYVAWLRPRADDRERITFFLGENTGDGFAAEHHPFSLGEALAGSVWQDGQPGAHSAGSPHPKCKVRADCKNESYVCVPVGRSAGSGGVLGFGSNEGFEATREQIQVLEAFAAVLAAGVAAEGLAGRGGEAR